MKKIAAFFLSFMMLATLAVPSFSAFAEAEPIEPLKPSKVKMTFAAWADPQVSNYLIKREPYLISSANDLKDNKKGTVDALVLAGDITENSIADEWQWVYDDIKNIGVKNYIAATGNHDIRLHDYDDVVDTFSNFTNRLNKKAGSGLRINALHYSYSVNGYQFIVLGSDTASFEEADIHAYQLQWLDKELKKAAKNYRPVFVVLHQPLKNTHGLPDTWGSASKTAGSVGAQSNQIKNILNQYGNVILITGHLHTGFGRYTYQKVGNVYSVNLPSLCIDNQDGSYNDNGIGYMVEVYDKNVVFRARNFDQGVYVPKYDVNINLYSAKVRLSKKSYRYNGRVKKPSVNVTDVYGKTIPKKYYSVKYQKGRRMPGKYKVTVTFKGKYKSNGKIVRTFKIKKK